MVKQYIPVILYVDETGRTVPKQFKPLHYNEWIKITKVKDVRRMASLRVGGVGVRHTCVIDYQGETRELYLFDECGKWFIEADGE